VLQPAREDATHLQDEGFGAVEITELEQSDQSQPVDGEHHPAPVSIAARQPALNASKRPGPTNAAPA
jgi:hypothetical protein